MALSSLDSQLLLSLVSRLSTYFHFTNLKFFFLLLLVSFQNNVYLHKCNIDIDEWNNKSTVTLEYIRDLKQC